MATLRLVRFVAIAIVAAFFTTNFCVVAQPKTSVPDAQSAFDTVLTKDHSVYRGFYLMTEPNGDVIFLVDRKWLKVTDRHYDAHAARCFKQEKLAYEQIRDRIAAILKRDPNAPHAFILQRELERADTWLKSEEHIESQLMLISFPQNTVVRSTPSTPERARLGRWAWSKEIELAENRDVQSIEKELKDLRTDVNSDAPDLTSRFHALPQSEEEWAARLALVEYTHVERVAFQGTGELMIRISDDGKAPDLGPIFAKLMQSQVQSIIDELLGDKPSRQSGGNSRPPWMRISFSKADELGKPYVRGTTVETEMLEGRVTVSSMFAIKLANGNWQPIWRQTHEQDTRNLPASVLQTIEDDPQVKSIREKIEDLGFGATSELNHSIRFGAATMMSQKEVDYQFELFRQRYMERLDLPVLRWRGDGY